LNCPYCGHYDSRVMDSRDVNDGIRRRRQCLACGLRFTTYERLQPGGLYVIKKDGRREHYSREKIMNGLLRACEKRPVSREALEKLVDDVEESIGRRVRDEIPTSEIGNEIIKHLGGLDQVAYVRFASVYREFKDVTQFLDELRGLLEKRR